MSIDLREEMSEILKESGHPVLLQRDSRKMHCRCWNPDTNEAKPRCPYCNGSGWVNRMERHVVRRDRGTMPISWSNRDKDTEIGKQLQDADVYYFSYNSFPKVGDILYEVGWNERGRPTHVIKASKISYVFEHRADNGRIEYFQASCSNEVMDKSFKTIQVRKLGNIKNYEPIK
jgi:hypothetical protein